MENRTAIPEVISNPEMIKVPYRVDINPSLCGAMLSALNLPDSAIHRLQIEVSPKTPPNATPQRMKTADFDREKHIIGVYPTPLWNVTQCLLARRELLWSGNATTRLVAQDSLDHIVVIDEALGKPENDDKTKENKN